MHEFLKQLSIKYNLPIPIVQAIVESPFRLHSEEMEKGNFTGTKYMFLGKIVAPEFRVKEYLERLEQEEIQRELSADKTHI